MRVFELTTRIKAVQRSQGDSATAKAAYRACCVIECEREGRTHDYSRKQGLEASEIVLPDKAPAWAKNRSKLWNAAEMAERNKDKRAKTRFKKDAQTARDLLYSIPAELSKEGRLKTARIIARYLVSVSSVAVDFNIHEPGKDGDQKNYHCHIMFSTRELTSKGFGKKTREWDERNDKAPSEARKLRAFIAQTLNAELKAEGKADIARVEHESFKDRGMPQKPVQQHQGPAKTHMLRKQQQQARKAWEQAQRRDQRQRHGKERASLKLRQDFDLQRKLAELEQRAREGREAIDRQLQAARKADIPATGFRRVFQIVTQQDMREAFNRQHREAERVNEAEQKRGGLTAEIQAERSAYIRGQLQDREKLAERHNGEDRQLNEAAMHRASLDRTAEVHARQAFTRSNSRQNELQQEQGRGRSIERDIPPP